MTFPPAPDAFGNADFLTVELDPQQAMTGIDTSVTLPDGRSITVRLPAGVPHGMVLRLTTPDQAAGARDIFLQVVLTSAVPTPLVTPPETASPAATVQPPAAATPVQAEPPRTRWWRRSSAGSSGPGATAAVEPTQPTDRVASPPPTAAAEAVEPTVPVEPPLASNHVESQPPTDPVETTQPTTTVESPLPTGHVESTPPTTPIESTELTGRVEPAPPIVPAETAAPTPTDSTPPIASLEAPKPTPPVEATQPTAFLEGAPTDHVESSQPSVPAGSSEAPAAGPAREVGEFTTIAAASATSTVADDEATTADADGTGTATDADTGSTPAATVADISPVDNTATADAATAADAHADASATTTTAAAEAGTLSGDPVADAPVGTDVQGAAESAGVTVPQGATGLAVAADAAEASTVAPPTVSAEGFVPTMVPPMSAPPYPYGPQFPPPYLTPAPRSRRMAGWQIAVSAVAILVFAAFGGAATAVVRYASNAGEPTPRPAAAGNPTPGPTLTTKPRMTAGAYQKKLTEVDTAIGAGVAALAQAGNPTAVDKAAVAIAAAAEKGHTDLLAVVPPKNAEKAHEGLTDALDELADSGTQLSMSAQSGGVCMASSAMPRFSGYPVMQTLRSAFEALAAADTAHPYTMGAWLPAPTQDQNRQPGNGTYLKNGSRSGSGQMKLDSKDNASDAVLGLVGVGTDSMVFTVYVRAGSAFTVTGVRNGNYDVYVTMGTDWDPDKGGFSRNCNFTKFDQSIEFTNSSTTYTVWSITLQYVAGGGGTLTVDPDKFPR